MVGGCGWRSVGTYTMTIQTLRDDHPDTASEATRVVVGEAMPGGLDHDGDVDYFVFNAEAGQLYEIRTVRGTVQHADVSVPCDQDEDLEDYRFTDDSSVLWVAPSRATTSFAWAAANRFLLPGGLRLRHRRRSLKLPVEATPLTLGEAISGVLDYEQDVDAFRIASDAGTIYEIAVELGTLSGSVVSSKAPINCEQQRDRREVDYEDSNSIFKVRSAAQLYVYVCGVGTGTYTLTVSVSDLQDDYPDSWTGASTIAVNDVVHGALGVRVGRGLLLVRGGTRVEYTLGVSSDSSPYSVVAVGETTGTLLAHDDDNRESEPPQIVWEAPASGTYWVAVYSQGEGPTR